MVLRRNSNGQLFLAADLRPATAEAFLIDAPAAQSLAVTRSGAAAAALSVDLLKALVPGFTPSLSTEVRDGWTGTFSYSDLRDLRTWDEPIRTLARQWAQSNRLQDGNRYFLIRDSRTARQVTMEVTRQSAAQLGIGAAIELAVTANASATLDKGASYRLTSAVEPPVAVCHVLEEFDQIVPGGAPGPLSASGSGLRFVPVTDVQQLPPVVR